MEGYLDEEKVCEVVEQEEEVELEEQVDWADGRHIQEAMTL